ncbi:MAG: hypothetical protein IPO92_16870 [Saprospiraceae bacterium]|nr:hypothetical protein [Saprospiraceae bacterium]
MDKKEVQPGTKEALNMYQMIRKEKPNLSIIGQKGIVNDFFRLYQEPCEGRSSLLFLRGLRVKTPLAYRLDRKKEMPPAQGKDQIKCKCFFLKYTNTRALKIINI